MYTRKVSLYKTYRNTRTVMTNTMDHFMNLLSIKILKMSLSIPLV